MTASYSQSRRTMGWAAPSFVFIAACCVGCEHKAERYDLAGTVTFRGRPVPAGYMVINPDVSAGNHGPGTTATIVGGHYKTLPGRGTIGGPHVVTVFGFDGHEYAMSGGMTNSLGKPLCKSDVLADLPRENGTCEIVVPGRSR